MRGSTLSTAVVIPLYNGGPWIERTLRSVAAQTRPPADVIVVDDGSTDDSVSRVRGIPNVRVLKNPGKGVRLARNLGLNSTTADLVAFLDQDDVWHATHLDHLAGALEARPSAAVAAADGVILGPDDDPSWPEPVTADIRAVDPWAAFPFGTIRCPSMALARRDAVLAVGGWNPETRHVADIELWLRMAAHGDVVLSDRATVGVREHRDSYSSRLRAERIDEHLQSLGAMARTMGNERKAQRPDEDEWVTRRVDVTERFRAIGQRFLAGDANGAVRTLGALFDDLKDEPVHFQSDALQTLCWFLCPPALPARQRRLLAHLHGAWPAESLGFRSHLWAQMKHWPLSFFLGYLIRRPWERRRLALLQEVVGARGEAIDGTTGHRGVDQDGWARQECVVQVPRRDGVNGVVISIELPGWFPSEWHDVRVVVDHQPPAEAHLRSGRYDVVIPGNSAAPALSVAIRCLPACRLPGQERIRSLRITGIRHDDLPLDARLSIEPR